MRIENLYTEFLVENESKFILKLYLVVFYFVEALLSSDFGKIAMFLTL